LTAGYSVVPVRGYRGQAAVRQNVIRLRFYGIAEVFMQQRFLKKQEGDHIVMNFLHLASIILAVSLCANCQALTVKNNLSGVDEIWLSIAKDQKGLIHQEFRKVLVNGKYVFKIPDDKLNLMKAHTNSKKLVTLSLTALKKNPDLKLRTVVSEFPNVIVAGTSAEIDSIKESEIVLGPAENQCGCTMEKNKNASSIALGMAVKN
jgi:hypothetical protein